MGIPFEPDADIVLPDGTIIPVQCYDDAILTAEDVKAEERGGTVFYQYTIINGRIAKQTPIQGAKLVMR